jgi:predicted LPLAT superfamily acyltransferase
MFCRTLFDPTDSHCDKVMLLGHHLGSLKVIRHIASIHTIARLRPRSNYNRLAFTSIDTAFTKHDFRCIYTNVNFEVYTAMKLKMPVTWDVTLHPL